jgi:hypothetical protein
VGVEAKAVGLGTLMRYLFLGDRQAILTIAGSRRGLWVGLLFVLSAGLAREYDGEDLLHEPWHAVIPLGASLASSFLLFSVAYAAVTLHSPPDGRFFPRYLSFLGLFWMTAPLAWLYAVPYERFLSPVGAVQANLITLGVVATWRVALMGRVLTIIFGYRAGSAFFLVLLFADVLMLVLLQFLPVPLLDVMGGIRLTEGERVIQEVAEAVCLLGWLSLPVWAVGAMLVAVVTRPGWRVPDAQPLPQPTRSLMAFAIISVLAWAAVLPFTQPEQLKRRQVERVYAAGNMKKAVALMARHRREDFPPHWDPPPRLSSGLARELAPEVLDILEHLETIDAPEWVWAAYVGKMGNLLGAFWAVRGELQDRAVAVLKRVPGGKEELERVEQQSGRPLERKRPVPRPEEGGKKEGPDRD